MALECALTRLHAHGHDERGKVLACSLHVAALNGHYAAVNDLLAVLRRHLVPLVSFRVTCLTLWAAACSGNVDVLQLFLASHNMMPEEDFQEDLGSALHVAVRDGHLAAVEILLCAKANVNESCSVRQTDNWTLQLQHRLTNRHCRNKPLHTAARHGRVDIIATLLRAKADMEACDGTTNACTYVNGTSNPSDDGTSNGMPVMVAAERGQAAAIEVLVAAKASVNNSVAFEYSTRRGHARRVEGYTPLHAAYHVDSARTLLRLKARTDLTTTSGRTVLDMAMHRTDVFQVLLGARATLSTWFRCAGVLFDQRARPRMFSLLLRAGVHVDVRDATGCTALHMAARRGDARFAAKLLRAKASVDVENLAGQTPILYARSADVAQVLMAAKASPWQGDAAARSAEYRVCCCDYCMCRSSENW
jgi:ankyrin repeat protein